MTEKRKTLAEIVSKTSANALAAVALKKQGLTRKEIANHFGVCVARVGQFLVRAERDKLRKQRAIKNPLHRLSRRAFNVLKNKGITEIKHLETVTDHYLLSLENCGKTTASEIMALKKEYCK